MASNQPSVRDYLTRGVASGVAGTVIMTVFQKFVEMPLTQRPESYAPARFTETVTSLEPQHQQGVGD